MAHESVEYHRLGFRLLMHEYRLSEEFCWMTPGKEGMVYAYRYPPEKNKTSSMGWKSWWTAVQQYDFGKFRKFMKAASIFDKTFGHLMQRYEKEYFETIKKPFIELYLVAVLPEHQGKGVGKQLIRHVIQYARQHRMDLYLEATTTESKRFYEQLGFVETGKTIQPKPPRTIEKVPPFLFPMVYQVDDKMVNNNQ